MSITELYHNLLKYNCGYAIQGTKDNQLIIVYLGCDNFIIINNHYGVVAYGSREWDDNKNKSLIDYVITKSNFTPGDIERLIINYEKNNLNIASNKVVVRRV